jgi:hypothetical protein
MWKNPFRKVNVFLKKAAVLYWVHDSLCGPLTAQSSSLLETQPVFDVILTGKMPALRKLSRTLLDFSPLYD